jgi:predicted adenylyl cyclase CyaB
MKKEVEVRSFISKEKYQELKKFFNKKAKLLEERSEETFYLDCKQDLRIQKTSDKAKVWLKKGKIHDNSREELEILFNRKDFKKMKEMFKEIGFSPEIEWKRNRLVYKWDDVTCMLDHTENYGYIIELEKIVDKKETKEVYDRLKEKLQSLGVSITPKEEFNKRYKEYKKKYSLKK